jgi:hypothetical protein
MASASIAMRPFGACGIGGNPPPAGRMPPTTGSSPVRDWPAESASRTVSASRATTVR